jgi:phosphoglycolate phosphatase-like HAD superfamily hydrolase
MARTVAKRTTGTRDIDLARKILKWSTSVVCDFDDTLVATFKIRSGTLIRTAAQFGIQIDSRSIERLWGLPFPELIGNLLPDLAIEDFLRLYRLEMQNDRAVAQPGASTLLKYCSGASKLFIIHSSSRTDLIEQDIASLHWTSYVDAVFGIDQTNYAKPDPRSMEVPLSWLKSRSEDLHRTVYIGDSANDFLVADQCGLPFIGVHSGLALDLTPYGTDAPVIPTLGSLSVLDSHDQ